MTDFLNKTYLVAGLFLALCSPLLGFEQEPPPEVRPPALIEPAAGGPAAAQQQEMLRLAARGQDAEAAVIARRVLETIQNAPAATPQQLADAWSNLGALQYRNGEFGAAVASYGAAVDALGSAGNYRDPRLATPLFGLGVSQTAAGDHAAAIDTLQRAIFIARADQGLQDPAQLAHDNALMQSLLISGRVEEALDRQSVRTKIMTQALGKTPELIPTIDEAAKWYRVLQHYDLEAEAIEEKVEILENEHGEDDIAVVDAYRQLAQAYNRFIGTDVDKLRLLLRRDNTTLTVNRGGFFLSPSQARRLEDELDQPTPREQRILDAERAAYSNLKKALRIQEKHPDTPAAELATTETLLGDHYQATGKYRSARRYYKEAYSRLLSAGDQATIDHLFGAPKPLYRKPMRQPRSDDPALLAAYSGAAQLTMRVTRQGKARDVELVSVEPTSARRLSGEIERNARKTVFRPRMTERGPVDTDKVTLRYPLVPKPSR